MDLSKLPPSAAAAVRDAGLPKRCIEGERFRCDAAAVDAIEAQERSKMLSLPASHFQSLTPFLHTADAAQLMADERTPHPARGLAANHP